MKTELTMSLRVFRVTVRDGRSNEVRENTLTVTKEQLRAAWLCGLDSRDYIRRLYGREGYAVLEIGKPVKRDIVLELEGGGAFVCDDC